VDNFLDLVIITGTQTRIEGFPRFFQKFG
jgi:hypothetical protein